MMKSRPQQFLGQVKEENATFSPKMACTRSCCKAASLSDKMDASIPFTDWSAKSLNNLHKFMREYLEVSNYLSIFAAYFTFSKAALNRKHNPLRYFYTPSVHISVSYPRVEC